MLHCHQHSLTISALSVDKQQIALMPLNVDIEVFAVLAPDGLVSAIVFYACWVTCRLIFAALLGLHHLSWLDMSLLRTDYQNCVVLSLHLTEYVWCSLFMLSTSAADLLNLLLAGDLTVSIFT